MRDLLLVLGSMIVGGGLATFGIFIFLAVNWKGPY